MRAQVAQSITLPTIVALRRYQQYNWPVTKTFIIAPANQDREYALFIPLKSPRVFHMLKWLPLWK